ncbi:dihydrofolate reductase [Anaerotaenia torta]|uniref:dihydrofolate reductase n=1 Tax=Anaerotaenia torta TaxID=433293 RepID=UPI003D1C9495
MNVIAAVDKNWAIGHRNQLLVSIPADMRFFRDETMGKVVIMGRNTLESFPGGQPLKNRRNIVISRKKDYRVKDADVVNSIEEALELVKDCPRENIYVIGGASIYRQMLQYCETAHITKIDYGYHADTYFPNLDQMEDWVLAEETEEQTYYDLTYTFCRYERKPSIAVK